MYITIFHVFQFNCQEAEIWQWIGSTCLKLCWMAALCLWSNLCGIYPIGTRMHKSHWEFCPVFMSEVDERERLAHEASAAQINFNLAHEMRGRMVVDWWSWWYDVICDTWAFVLWHVVLLDVGSSLARSHVSRCMSQSSTCHRARTSFQISMAAADT